jgi:hypothetical protein
MLGENDTGNTKCPPFFVAVRAVDRANSTAKSMQYPAATDIMRKCSSFPPGRQTTARRWFGCLITHTTKPRLVQYCIVLIVYTRQRYLDIPNYPLEMAMTPLAPRVPAVPTVPTRTFFTTSNA